jgi:hypothetical protein
MDITVSDDDAIAIHLTLLSSTNVGTFFSGFMGGIRDARKFTKRNQDTGVKDFNDTCGDLGSWLGSIGYMVVLNQIGNCFKPKSEPALGTNVNAFTRALKYFSILNDNEIDALYALRCSLAHDFSLVNVNSKLSLTHIFSVNQDETAPIVILPKTQWDGKQETVVGPEHATHINLRALGDLVEDIYGKLITLSQASQLEVVLPGKSKELLRRYTIFVPNSYTVGI